MSLDETLQSYEPAVAFLRRVTGARLVCGSQSLALPLAIPSLLLLLLLLLSRRVHVTSLVRSTPTPTQRSNLTTGILVVIALPVHSCLILEDCCVYSRPLLLSVCISLQLRTRALSRSACFATMLSSIVRRAVRAIGSRPVASVAASRTLSRQMSSTYCASRFVPASLRSFTATSR